MLGPGQALLYVSSSAFALLQLVRNVRPYRALRYEPSTVRR